MADRVLARRLRALRRKADLTQAQVSDVLSVKRSAYAYYEIGKSEPRVETIKQIAKMYGVTVDALLSEDLTIMVTQDETLDEVLNGFEDKFFDLSDVEKQLVCKFRTLPKSQKRYVINTLLKPVSEDEEDK